MSAELDGTYLISTISNYEGPLERKSDGITEIRGGQTDRLDDNEVQWISTFTIMNQDEVKMTSIADPTNAEPGFALTKPDGTPTRGKVTYETTLKYSKKGDRIQLSGQIQYGKELIVLTMRKIGQLPPTDAFRTY